MYIIYIEWLKTHHTLLELKTLVSFYQYICEGYKYVRKFSQQFVNGKKKATWSMFEQKESKTNCEREK
jgi:hypothetical protein